MPIENMNVFWVDSMEGPEIKYWNEWVQFFLSKEERLQIRKPIFLLLWILNLISFSPSCVFENQM